MKCSHLPVTAYGTAIAISILLLFSNGPAYSQQKISGIYRIEISVSDNGMGIPQKVIDKIFQPFFTTKLTKQGTGTDLSLAYDIITTHGGVPIAIGMKMKTKEGEGTEFIILLPIRQN